MFEPAHRVELDRRVLFLGQLPRLLQDPGRHAELAHVVQHARVPQRLHPFAAHADLPRDHDRTARDPVAVATGVEVLGLDRLAQRADRGLVRPLLLHDLRHGPAGDGYGDQDEDRREQPGHVPQRGDEQAERAVAEVGGDQLQAHAGCGGAASPLLRPVGQPEHAAEQPVVRDRVHDGRDREGPDDPGERSRHRLAYVSVRGDEGPAGQVRGQGEHAGVEHALDQRGTAPQPEQGAGADQRRADRSDQDHGGQSRDRGRRPRQFLRAQQRRRRLEDHQEHAEHGDLAPPGDPAERAADEQHRGRDDDRADVQPRGPRQPSHASPWRGARNAGQASRLLPPRNPGEGGQAGRACRCLIRGRCDSAGGTHGADLPNVQLPTAQQISP